MTRTANTVDAARVELRLPGVKAIWPKLAAQSDKEARRELALEAAIARLDRYDLLILDDIAYVTKDQAETACCSS
jgi:hypothetical protein